MRTTVTVALLSALVLAVVALYATRLAYAPPPLHRDEVVVARQAQALASTAHDLNGRFLPLYVRVRDDAWLPPVAVYLTVLVLKILPVSVWAVRLPSALVGVLDVILLYAIARRLFRREHLALVAAGLLAMTPAHFIHARLTMDAIYPVPFILGWLLCLVVAMERPRGLPVFLGTVILGLGFFSRPEAVVMMPVYLLLTWSALRRSGAASPRMYVAAVVGFLLPIALLLGPWLLLYPRTYMDTVGKFGIHQAYVKNPIQGVRAFFNWGTLSVRGTIYWEYFNPVFLFASGGSSPVNTTGHAGVFLLPLAVFRPVGAYEFAKPRTGSRAAPIHGVLLLGFLLAPFAAATVDQRYATERVLEMLPFAVLIATYGVDRLLSARASRWVGMWRVAGVVLLVLVPLQFCVFYRDYMTGYRARASASFDGRLPGE